MSTNPSKPRTTKVTCILKDGSSCSRSLGSERTAIAASSSMITSIAFHQYHESLRSNRRRFFLISSDGLSFTSAGGDDMVECIEPGAFEFIKPHALQSNSQR